MCPALGLWGALVPFRWLAVVNLDQEPGTRKASGLWGALVPFWWLAVVYLAQEPRNSGLSDARTMARTAGLWPL